MFETFGGYYTIKQILKDNWPWFFKKYKGKLRDSIVENVKKILACGDKDKMGYHLYKCPKCGERKYVAHTCKSRFCNSCGKILTDKWVNDTCSYFLNVPHHHIVFNPPSELWYLFAFNRDKLDLLFEVTQEAIMSWCLENGILPGMCSVMHTFGSILNFDPHIHILITWGGMDTVNGNWRALNGIPHLMLKSRFRTLLVKKLRHLAKENRLSIPDDLRKIWREKYNFWGNFYALTQKLYDYIWYVHIGKKLENAYFTVRYIGRYARRPSIAETRILHYSYEEQTVVFQYHDKHTNAEKTTTLSVEKFISRLIRHIPEKNFRMIRYYGLYSNRMKTFYTGLLAGNIIDLFGVSNLQFNPNDGSRYKNWRERIMALTGNDPLVCSQCNEPMKLVEVAYRTRDGPLKTIIP